MNMSAQLARKSVLRVRVNRKVATTVADNNKQGDVQAMEFDMPGCDDLVWNVFLVSAAACSIASMVSCNSVTTLTLGLAARSEDTDAVTLSRTSLSHLRSYLSLARFTMNVYVSCG